jgi:glucose/arabinose dehydrogenase
MVLVSALAAACSPHPTPGPPTPTASESPTPSSGPPNVRAVRIATVAQPLAMAYRAGDPALYVAGKGGQIWAMRDGRIDPHPVLDLSGLVSNGSEQGLLGLAFSPSGAFLYVNYTDFRGNTNVVEYAWRDGRPDPSTRRLVLFVKQPFPNHNGGNLVFGPDGDLYIGMGDGGSDYSFGDPQGDPYRNGQNLGVLLGKMLRIRPRTAGGSLSPDGRPNLVPADNPFVHRKGARPEIWAYGLRNPWRYSFDRVTGDLWIGDVGAGAEEEIDLQPATSRGGQNYGWNALEGTFHWRKAPKNAVPPLYEYNHSSGRCAVTGGYVYRGEAITALRGWYVFADYCDGTVMGLSPGPGRRLPYVISGASLVDLSSFGQDQQGELYAMTLHGGIYKLEP